MPPPTPVIRLNGVVVANGAELEAALGEELTVDLQSTTGYTSFAWRFGKPVGSSSATGFSTTLTPTAPGLYRILGVATGPAGTSSARLTVSIVRTSVRGLRKAETNSIQTVDEAVADLKTRFNDLADSLDANHFPDTGPPRILYAGARTIRALSPHKRVLLNGFRAGGHYSKRSGPVCDLDRDSATAYDLATQYDGFDAPGIDAGSPEMWIAVFACRRPGETEATIRFVPFLRATAYDAQTQTVTFDPVAGAMTTGSDWTGVDILACHESGSFSWRSTTIASNTATTVTLSSALTLAAGDYLLPAPSQGADYKYLCSLKLDYAPGANEWRNFAFSGRDTNSTTGNPFGNITSLTDIPLDMRGYVSPLATGWIAAIQAYGSQVDASGAALYLSHDQGSLHAVARVAIDRVPTAGIGVTCTVRAAFGAKQETYARVVNANSVGTVDILGWFE